MLLYSWTRPQVLARAHPNVLAASKWLNNFYHLKDGTTVNGVDLSTPLSYADRFRIRLPGSQWNIHPPHVDGEWNQITVVWDSLLMLRQVALLRDGRMNLSVNASLISSTETGKNTTRTTSVLE